MYVEALRKVLSVIDMTNPSHPDYNDSCADAIQALCELDAEIRAYVGCKALPEPCDTPMELKDAGYRIERGTNIEDTGLYGLYWWTQSGGADTRVSHAEFLTGADAVDDAIRDMQEGN